MRAVVVKGDIFLYLGRDSWRAESRENEPEWGDGLGAVLAVYIASWDWDLASIVHLLGGNTYVRVGLETGSGTGADKAAKICDWK